MRIIMGKTIQIKIDIMCKVAQGEGERIIEN
jgi:hypothetical protein